MKRTIAMFDKQDSQQSFHSFAKINLSLQLRGKRADGYHELISCVAFCDVGDILHLTPSDELSLKVTGEQAGDLMSSHVSDDNLVLKAANALRSYANTPLNGVNIILEKHLPIGSGIGGGSGDAATILRGLNHLWQCNLDDRALASIGMTLGADVPVCLHGRACYMEGMGEKITPLPDLPELYAALVNPLQSIATSDVFAQIKTKDMTGYDDVMPLPSLSLNAIRLMHNDMTRVAIALCPEISDILETLHSQKQVLCARMSGSGATCVGLFTHRIDAETAYNVMKDRYPDYWVAIGKLR